MSLLFIDGFDAYGADGANINSIMATSGWVTSGYFSEAQLARADTRTGVGFSMNTNSSLSDTVLPFKTSTGIVIGFAFKCPQDGVDSNGALGGIIKFRYNNLLGTVYNQLDVAINGQNGISLIDGDFNLVAASNPNVLFYGAWQYIEVMYVPGFGSAGSIVVKIDGAIVASATGAKTMNSQAAALVNELCFGMSEGSTQTHPGIGGTNALYDDLYLCDTLGTTFNTFQGDCVVHSVFPSADAGPNAMAQTGGGAGHFTSVDEQAPDGDTSYLSTNAANVQEMFAIGTLPTDMVDVLALAVNVRARKDATGTGMYEACLAQGGTELDSGPIAAAANYVTSQTIYPQPPAGGAWTKISAQAATIGFKSV